MNRTQSIPEIQVNDLAPEAMRQSVIAKLKTTPLAFDFNGKRQSFQSIEDLTDRVELHTNYYNSLMAAKTLGRSDLDTDIDRMAQWLTLADSLLNDVQSKLANGTYKEARYD